MEKTINSAFLLQQMQLGSEQAFATLYDHFSTALYRNILRMVADEDIAKELLQDLFLKLWTKRESLDASIAIKPYLYRMAANFVCNHFRKFAQDRNLIDRLIDLTVDFDPPVEDRIMRMETEALLRDAINDLPPKRKRVFILCKIEGKSYNEVSELLGISNGTINEHIVKANRSIKQYFVTNQNLAVLLIAAQLLHH